MTGLRGSEQRFDEELLRAARALVTEDLPRGVLDPAVGAAAGPGGPIGLAVGPADGRVRSRRGLPGFAGLAAAVAVLLLATALAFGPGGPGGPFVSAAPSRTASPAPSPTPGGLVTLRPSADIRADFELLGYTCRAGQPLASATPGPSAVVRESVVCTPAANGDYLAAVVVGESASGAVVEVHAKGDFIGDDTSSARATLASALGKAAAVVVRAGSGTAVGAWVESNLPGIEPGEAVKAQVEGYALKIARTSDGGYQLFVAIAATS